MLFSLLIVALITYWLYHELYGKRKGLPPGPIPLPIVGNIFQIDFKRPDKTFIEWGKKYGPVFSVWMPLHQVLINDYELIKGSVLKQGDIYIGRPTLFTFSVFVAPGTSDLGLVFSVGPHWREQRRFALHVLRDFGFGKNVMEEKIMTEVKRLTDHIDSHIDKSGNFVAKPKDILSICVGSIISCLVFGHPYEFGDQRFNQLKKLLTENVQIFFDPRIMMLEVWPWLRFLPYVKTAFDDLLYHEKKFNQFFQEEINAHKEVFDPNNEPNDYLESFLKEKHRREEVGEPVGSFTESQLYLASLDLWGAGMETTVTTLCWGIIYMLYYPEVAEKVRKEIDDVVGQDSDVTLAHKNQLPYVTATINELQRIGNVIPFNVPHATTQDTEIGGCSIEKGTTILPNISAVHMDPKIFPNPEKFDPERFLEDDKKTVKKVDQLMPFSIGKRQCLGESLARMELFLIFSTLMHKYKFTTPIGQAKPSLNGVFSFTCAPEEYDVMIEKL